MSKVLKIGISKNFGDKMQTVDNAEAIAGKGLVNDRHFKQNNKNKCQITLIEIENINYYNQISETKIPNELVSKEFFIGKVKVKAHDLCRPCKYLQELLKRNNIIKEFLRKGGLRCEILTNGKIFAGDKIK